jgi:high affinity sulfate transporter 1
MPAGERPVTRLIDRLERLAPGFARLLRYERRDLPHDLVAGASVAAVSIPSSIAYAQLAGFSPVVGLYASILPPIAYALFGTSRQLMIGPTAASSALVAAAVAPLVGGDESLYLGASMVLALLVALICIGASVLRLGAIADFLSNPILVGFMNGIAISILLGQAARLAGIPVEASAPLYAFLEAARRLGEIHGPTLAVAAGTFALLAGAPRVLPRVPAALVAIVVAGLAVKLLGLHGLGVATVGEIPGGLPAPRLVAVPFDTLVTLAFEAAGLALVAFSTMMASARSFAARRRYEIDADREFAALGAANVAAALSQSFVVSGAGSRTAVGDAAGGRTQLTGIVASVFLALVLVFLTGALAYLPVAALAAVLIMASLRLFDWRRLRAIRRIDRLEFWLGVVVMAGVVAIGAMDALLLAVALALVRFVRITSRPRVDILGRIAGEPGYHAVARHSAARTEPGLILFRFNGPVVFFSAPYFRRQLLAAAAGPDVRWVVIDLMPISQVDATGLYAIRDTVAALRERGIVVAAASRQAEWATWAAARGLTETFGIIRFFPSLRRAVRAYRAEVRAVSGDAAPDGHDTGPAPRAEPARHTRGD